MRVDFANGVVRERDNLLGGDALNFQVKDLSPHVLTHEVDSFSAFGAWALMNEDSSAAAIARSGPRAWIDLNNNGQFESGDAVQPFAIAVPGRSAKGSSSSSATMRSFRISSSRKATLRW